MSIGNEVDEEVELVGGGPYDGLRMADPGEDTLVMEYPPHTMVGENNEAIITPTEKTSKYIYYRTEREDGGIVYDYRTGG